MKPFVITLVCVALVLGFSTVTGLGQSKRETCENERRQVNELKKQAYLVSEQLESDTRDEDRARTALADFNDALSNPARRRATLETHLGS